MDINLLPSTTPARAGDTYSPQQIDYILDAIYGRTLTDDERATLLCEIMPYASPRLSGGNADLVTSDFAQKYANCRGMGLTQADAARYCGITPSILASMFRGEGLSKKQHNMILTAEHDSKARFIYRNLKVMHDAAQDGKWQAALALLEKVHPDEYGRRVEVNNSGSIIMGTGECEEKAIAAATELQALRNQRASEERQRLDESETASASEG